VLAKIQNGTALNDGELIEVGRTAGEILKGPRP